MKTIVTNKIYTIAAWGLLAVALCVMPFASAMADKSNIEEIGKSAQRPMVDIMLGKAEVVSIEGNVADVLVANPSIVDVMAVKSNRLYLVGAALGDTNIIALDPEGNILKQLNVHVQMDLEKVSMMIKDMYPNEKVELNAMTDQVVVTGDVSTPAVASKIVNLVGHYAAEMQDVGDAPVDQIVVNMLGVRGEMQVMLKVKIVEASRSALKDLGLETDLATAPSGNFSASAATANALGLASPTQIFALGLQYATGNFGPLSLISRALEQEGIVNTLAEPNLTAISGEQAGFLAGGEFPIPTQLDQNGNLIYEFRPFGVSLNFRPVVMSENRISMQLSTEVSTTSFDQNLQLQGINIPTFNVRRAQTTVELPSGGTLMIAGLLQSDTVSGLNQIPGVGDVPVLGDLVKSDSFRRDESELVVIITPYLVQPFAQNNAAPGNAPIPASFDQLGDLDGAIIAPAKPAEPAQAPVRQEDKTDAIFEQNIRRTYGDKVPDGLIKDTKSFGYIVD
jgi:pilus assembly protein CpaC